MPLTSPLEPDELPLSRAGLDRDHGAREREGLLDELWASPATRVLPILDGQAQLASPSRLALFPAAVVPRPAVSVYLGRTVEGRDDLPAGTPIVAALLEDAAHLAEVDWQHLRNVGHGLDALDAGIFTQALAILNWHSGFGFHPRTGHETVVESGGWVRRDPVSGEQVFPRTDPAVIVAVLDAEDRLLLGANALWGTGRFSLLAGFVDPGESLEAAVRREVEEESGLRVVEPRYIASQPWPFPSSLMLGFTAVVDVADPGELRPDGEEIVALRWFDRTGLLAAVDAGEVVLPGRTSIARVLIERWLGSRLE